MKNVPIIGLYNLFSIEYTHKSFCNGYLSMWHGIPNKAISISYFQNIAHEQEKTKT